MNDYIPKYTEMLTTEGNVDPSIMVNIYYIYYYKNIFIILTQIWKEQNKFSSFSLKNMMVIVLCWVPVLFKTGAGQSPVDFYDNMVVATVWS